MEELCSYCGGTGFIIPLGALKAKDANRLDEFFYQMCPKCKGYGFKREIGGKKINIEKT